VEAVRGLRLFASVEKRVVTGDASLGRHHGYTKTDDQNRKSLGEFNLEQTIGKGEKTAAVKHV